MNAIAFDTPKLARSLREKAKPTPEQAGGFADALSEAVHGELATKGDLAALGKDVQSWIRELELKIKDVESRLASQIESTKSELSKWTIGSVGLQTIAIVGAVIAIARPLRP